MCLYVNVTMIMVYIYLLTNNHIYYMYIYIASFFKLLLHIVKKEILIFNFNGLMYGNGLFIHKIAMEFFENFTCYFIQI